MEERLYIHKKKRRLFMTRKERKDQREARRKLRSWKARFVSDGRGCGEWVILNSNLLGVMNALADDPVLKEFVKSIGPLKKFPVFNPAEWIGKPDHLVLEASARPWLSPSGVRIRLSAASPSYHSQQKAFRPSPHILSPMVLGCRGRSRAARGPQASASRAAGGGGGDDGPSSGDPDPPPAPRPPLAGTIQEQTRLIEVGLRRLAGSVVAWQGGDIALSHRLAQQADDDLQAAIDLSMAALGAL